MRSPLSQGMPPPPPAGEAPSGAPPNLPRPLRKDFLLPPDHLMLQLQSN
jgi:hypothetical protein